MIYKNIVCFGPTNSGKSTLAGYLSSRSLSDEEYEKKVQQFREEYGNFFQERRLLSYFVDTGKDEYKEQERTPGTSKRKHISEAQLDDGISCTMIDTPGTDNRWKNGFQGIYFGDIGIFIIEINSLVELYMNYIKGSYEYNKHLNQLLLPVSLWEKYGRLNRLIIVISKMDLCDYSRYDFIMSEKILRGVEKLKHVPIIPIAINVKQRSTVNITSESEKFPNHKCLFSSIKDLMSNEPKFNASPINDSLFAAIDKRFDRTSSTGESALRFKVIDGNIRLGMPVIIGPVAYNDRISYLNGYVRSLMHEADRRQVDILIKNQIGGVIFSRLQNGRDVLNLKDIKLFNTSIIMDIESLYDSGNFLEFTLKDNLSTKEFFNSTRLNEDIKLIWFGKVEILRIITFVKRRNDYQLYLMNTKRDNYQFYLPKDSEGNFVYKDYVMQYKTGSEKEKFIQARLKNMLSISDESRKDVTVFLKTDYRNRLNQNKNDEMHYIENNNVTLLTLHNISGVELTDTLFKGDIEKKDIMEVAVKK